MGTDDRARLPVLSAEHVATLRKVVAATHEMLSAGRDPHDCWVAVRMDGFAEDLVSMRALDFERGRLRDRVRITKLGASALRDALLRERVRERSVVRDDAAFYTQRIAQAVAAYDVPAEEAALLADAARVGLRPAFVGNAQRVEATLVLTLGAQQEWPVVRALLERGYCVRGNASSHGKHPTLWKRYAPRGSTREDYRACVRGVERADGGALAKERAAASCTAARIPRRSDRQR